MATTTYLYRGQRIRGYRHAACTYRGGATYQHIECIAEKRRCRCGATHEHLAPSGRFERTFRALPTGRAANFIVLRGRIMACSSCGRRRRERIGFADGQRRYTRAFGRYVTDLCKVMTVDDVADLLGVGWDLIKEVHKEHLAKSYPRTDFSQVRYIGVDEFAIRKGHDYMTVVVDLETGEVLHAVEGKDGEAVMPFLFELREQASLEAVVIDMSAAYIKAVGAVFGDAVDVVHDRYHVVALVNIAIDETRRAIQRDMSANERKFIKGSRFVLLRGRERLAPNQKEVLARLLAINEPLSLAYILKEQLRLLWDFPGMLFETAELLSDDSLANLLRPWTRHRLAAGLLDRWVAMAKASGLPAFVRLASTISLRRKGILAYFRHPLTNGKVEGLNNKIKVLKRQAYGYRDVDYFKLRLYDLHNSKLKLN